MSSVGGILSCMESVNNAVQTLIMPAAIPLLSDKACFINYIINRHMMISILLYIFIHIHVKLVKWTAFHCLWMTYHFQEQIELISISILWDHFKRIKAIRTVSFHRLKFIKVPPLMSLGLSVVVLLHKTSLHWYVSACHLFVSPYFESPDSPAHTCTSSSIHTEASCVGLLPALCLHACMFPDLIRCCFFVFMCLPAFSCVTVITVINYNAGNVVPPTISCYFILSEEPLCIWLYWHVLYLKLKTCFCLFSSSLPCTHTEMVKRWT